MAEREKANCPGSAAAGAVALPRAARGRASTDGRPAGVSLRSTSHRPSCPKARRAMPRCRPGHRLPGPLPSRRRHADPGKPGPSIGPREDRTDSEPVGVARPRCDPCRPIRPTGEPAGPPRWLGGIRPCTVSADAVVPKRGSGPFSDLHHPEVASVRLAPRSPSALRCPVRRTHCRVASPQVKGYFAMHRVLPRTSSLRTGSVRSSTVRSQGCPHRRLSVRSSRAPCG